MGLGTWAINNGKISKEALEAINAVANAGCDRPQADEVAVQDDGESKPVTDWPTVNRDAAQS